MSVANELLIGDAALTVDRFILTDTVAGLCSFVVDAQTAFLNTLAGSLVAICLGVALATLRVWKASVRILFTAGTSGTGKRAADTRTTTSKLDTGIRAAVGRLAGAIEGA